MKNLQNTPTCTKSLKLLGDYWTLRIIDCLQQGELRFCVLQRELDNLNPVTLTNRLKKLEEAGLVARKETENTVSVSYHLTKRGHAAVPVIQAVNTFAATAS
jgi:DNA-binding HxlR family transcriptional regulator